MEIKEKVIVVTGGASGIGKALCKRFADENAKAVIVADVNEADASSVAEEVKGKAFKCDVRDEADVIRLARYTEENYGAIDLFCSNAGILNPQGGVECANADWQRIWEINVMSHVYVGRAVIPGMIARGGGAIMITASAAGLLSLKDYMPYSVTKHAAVGLAESIAITYGDKGIKVFVLCPLKVRTPMSGDVGIEPDQLAEIVMTGFNKETFLITSHPEVLTFLQKKTADYDRWLKIMRKMTDI